eukprot:s5372_g1.t1
MIAFLSRCGTESRAVLFHFCRLFLSFILWTSDTGLVPECATFEQKKLGHSLVYARRSAPPVGVAIGSELNLGDKNALAVRDYARAHPFEDVDPQALSAKAGAGPIADGAEPPQPDSGGQRPGGLLDSSMLHGDSAPVTPVEHGETEHDVEGGAAKKSHVERLHGPSDTGGIR